MKRIAYLLGIVCTAAATAGAAIDNVRVQGVTATNAVLTYTAPDEQPCTLQVSRSPSFVPLEADVDSSLFPGASSDARPGNITTGRSRVFVVGMRGAAKKAATGKYVSRALEADTLYYFRISCPSSGAVYPALPANPNTFRTMNIPLGSTYSDPPPTDPANPGTAAVPDLDYASRQTRIVDPVTGLGMKALSFPGDMWGSPASLTFGAAYNANAGPCEDGAWVNPCGAVNTGDPAARAAGSTEWLVLRPNPVAIGTGTAYYPDVGTSVDRLELSLTGSGDSASSLYRTAEVCLSVDGGASCATSIKEVTFDQGAYSVKVLNPLPASGTFGADPWLSSAKLSLPYINTYSGSVSVNGSDLTLGLKLYQNENAYFHNDWKSGSRILLTRNMEAPTTSGASGGTLAPNTPYYFKVVAEYPNGTFSDATEKKFTTGAADTAVNLSWTASPGAVQYRVYVGSVTGSENRYFTTTATSYTVTSLSGAPATVPPASFAECTISQVKSGESASLQDLGCISRANFTAGDINAYQAQNFVVMIRRKATDAAHPDEGLNIQYASLRYITSQHGGWPSTGGTTVCHRIAVDGGYYCGMPIGNGGFTMLYWVEKATGNAVPLGRMAVNPKTTGATDDRWAASQACGPTWDSTRSVPTFLCLVVSDTGKKLIVQGELLSCPGNPCFSHSQPALGWSGSASLGTGAASWGTYSVTYPNGVRWTILNPPSLGQDLIKQTKAINPAFDEANFSSVVLASVQNGYLIFAAHHGNQDTISYVGVFAPGDRDPTHAGQTNGPRVFALTNTWAGEPKCRWCTRHAILAGGDTDYAIIEANVAVTTSPTWGGGPWQVTTNTPIPNTTGACPDNPYGATDCITLTINPKTPLAYPDGDLWNYEPYDPNPAPDETQYVAPGALGLAHPGDLVCVSQTASCNFVTTPWNEVMRLISKSGNQWTFQRNVTYENNTKKQILGTGIKNLFFICTAIHPTKPGILGGVAYWHFTEDPLGQNMEIDQYNFASHQVFRPGFYTEALNDCPLSGTACYGTRMASLPDLFTTPITSKQNSNPPFAGATGPGSPTQKQSHPTYPNTDSSDYEKQAYFDVRPFINSGSFAFTRLGVSNVYKATWTTSDPDNFGPFNRKKLATEAWCGLHPLVDVSGPNSTIDDSTPYSYCIPRVNGSLECQDTARTRTTKMGEVYVSCPYVTDTSCQGANAFLFANPLTGIVDGAGKNLVQDICVTNAAAQGQAVVQTLTANDSFGQRFRKLSILTGRNKLTDVFSSARTVPDGSQIMWRWYWSDLFRSEILVAKLPPLPSADSVNRTDFVPVRVKLGRAPAGTASAIVEFGYEENRGAAFTDVIPPCTTRQEGCVKGNQPGNDFGFASETVTGSSCTAGSLCTMQIPAIPQRILYYRAIYLNSAKQIISRSATQVTAVP